MTFTAPNRTRRPPQPPPDSPHRPPHRSSGGSVAVAVLLVILGATGALWFASRGNDRVDVVTLNTALRRGQVVEPSDLTVARVAVDGARARVTSPAVARQTLIGRTVLVDLAAGTLITPEMVGSTAPPPGDASVGVQVPADALPSVRPAAGDWVQVVAGGSDGQARLIGGPVQVTAVTSTTTTGGDVVVYLVAPADTAQAIAGAAGTNTGVRLLGVRS